MQAQSVPIDHVDAPSPKVCPPGTHGCGFDIECSFENFHRPKFQCTRGFWLCVECTKPVPTCCPDAGFKLASFDSVTKMITVRINFVGKNKLEFRFPAAMKDNINYTEEDLKYFSVDEAKSFNLNGKNVKLITGDYKTEIIGSEIVVRVDYTI